LIDFASKALLPEGTPEGQARAVSCDDGLITVGAGAGTGKTWVLSARFARLLFSDPECLPQNILTLTFTEAAAREMQDRIRRRTFELIASLPGLSDQQKAEWRVVEDGFDEMWISTIHSFASRVIRESGLSLDLDPRSGVVSAPQEDAFWGSLERALENLDLLPLALHANKTLRETASFLKSDATLLAALEKWGPSVLSELAHDVTELHSSLGHSYETLLTWADDVEQVGATLLDAHARKASEAVLELLRPRWAEAWLLWKEIFADAELRRGIFEARDRALEKTEAKRINPAIPLADVAETWQAFLLEASPSPNVQRAFYLDLCSKLSGDNSKLFKAIAGRLGQTSGRWRDAQANWIALSEYPPSSPLSQQEQRLRTSLLRLSAFAWGVWNETKRRRGLLSFSDMIDFASQSILKDARTKGFKHVLIDEFQDTDPQQDIMIRTLREKEGAKLFLVGDPKQAIYRFRHADLTLFADYVSQSRASNSDVTLDVSFRTRAALMERINSLFARVWKDGLGVGKRMEGLKFEPLSVPELPERQLATVPPFTLLLSVKKGRGDNARERLDVGLARMFARHVKEGRTIWDKERRCLRPVRWKDFAVLTPTRGEYEILEAAFEEEGVPVVFEKSMSYFSRGEVVDVVNTLRVAAFPDDETALGGWLASPFSGVPQQEVQACLQTSAPLPGVVRERLPAAAQRLSYIRRLGSLKGPSAVLSYLLEDRRWLASFDAAQRLRVVGNVTRAIAVARQYENGVSPSLAGCAQWLDTALRAGRAIEEPEWMEPDADAVRVMTVHASKGLEFPVVAVMRMERGSRPRILTTVVASKHMGVALSDMPDMMKPDADEKDPEGEPEVKMYSLKWERALEAQSELEESTRLFYVAATRAQDSLILCGVVNEEDGGERTVKNDTWLSWTLDWLAAERDCDWRDLAGPPLVYAESQEPPSKELSILPLFGENETENELEGELGNSMPLSMSLPGADIALSSFSATSFALFEWCPFAWRRRHRQGLDLRWEVPDADSVGGSELGSIAHWILSRWDMREETLRDWLDNATVELRLSTALRETWRNAENRKALLGWFTDFSRSDEGRSLADAIQKGTLRRESPFCMAIDAANDAPDEGRGSPVRLVGATDVVWREEGRWHVRDYKITLSDNAPAELYRAQLAFYALVVKLLTERLSLPFDGVDVGLIFLREGGRLGDTKNFPGDGDWAAMQSQIAAVARAAARGPWIPHHERCHRCPWRLKCPKRA
jgi:ATP-dependent exoDNAse (exonuclease V) beta subunit